MPVEMAMWKMTSDGPLAIAPKKLNFEDRLEELVVNDPSLINLSILVIGHQIPTKYGGYIDVLGVDVEGRIHVIELKRDRTPREVVAQILDYGSWAQDLSLSAVHNSEPGSPLAARERRIRLVLESQLCGGCLGEGTVRHRVGEEDEPIGSLEHRWPYF